MMDDYHQPQFAECREKEEMEAASDAFYKMLDSAQRPLHDRTDVSQLDAIGRIMGLKAELNLSREGFDKMLAVWSGMLPKGHIMPKNLYESEKVLLARPTPTLSRVDKLQAELAETKETIAHLSAQLEATQKQMAEMYQIMQSLGQASGVAVQLPTLAPVRLFTSEYKSLMPSCRWDYWPSCRCDFQLSCRWDCRPSCHCDCWPSCRCFVQPPSAGSNNPAIVSPTADLVNPSPHSGPSRVQPSPSQ